MGEIQSQPTHDICPVCGKWLPMFQLSRHIQRCAVTPADGDLLSTYDAMHPNSASAKFAELVREAAARGK